MRLEPVVTVAIPGEERSVSVARGPREPIQPGPGFAVYEARVDPEGKTKEELVTVICGTEPILHAVTDEQLKAWKGKRLVARPIRLERQP
jgi:hypothetical protein